jgi:hypothetical protein
MDFTASWPSFSTPTHTHDFDNHSNGYDYLKDSTHSELADCRKTASSMVGNPEMVLELGEDYDF